MPLSVVADRLELLWGGWKKRLLGVQEEVCTCMYDELERGSKMGLEAIAGAGRLPRADEPS